MTDGLPVRRSGKVLLVNQDQQLLLFRANELLPEGGQREFWFPVGGGAEGDEGFAECAARELIEETGLHLPSERLGPVVAVRRGSFRFEGRDIWSDERYFFVSIASHNVDVSGFTELEQQIVTTHHWWSMSELRQTEQLVFPSPHELASLVLRLIGTGPIEQPIELSW